MQTLPPVVAAALPAGVDTAVSTALQHLSTTHDSKKLRSKAEQYVRTLASLLQGADVPQALQAGGLHQQKAGSQQDDMSVVHRQFGPACYIDSALPVTVHFLIKCATALCHQRGPCDTGLQCTCKTCCTDRVLLLPGAYVRHCARVFHGVWRATVTQGRRHFVGCCRSCVQVPERLRSRRVGQRECRW